MKMKKSQVRINATNAKESFVIRFREWIIKKVNKHLDQKEDYELARLS